MGLLSTFGAASGRAFGLTRSAIAAATDAFFNRVSLLLNTSSTNGAQNNTFLDSSSNNFTITRNGNTTQGTFTPFSQTGWSNYFGGSSWISVPDSTDLDLASGTSWTMEAWVYNTGSSGIQNIMGSQNSAGDVNFLVGLGASNELRVVWSNSTPTAYTVSAPSAITRNTWIHVAAVNNAGTLSLYVNGTSVGTPQSISGSFRNLSSVVAVGRSGDYASQYWVGYISNARIVNGTAVYTSNFTPPTAPLTDVTNTKLLTCKSNSFIDTNTQVTAKTVTVGGTPSVQAFSPFAPTTAYSTSTVGGSGYFDGGGDYLTMASNAALAPGTGDFTIEAWLYPTAALSTYNSVYETAATNGLLFGKITSGYGVRSAGTADLIASTAPAINQWVHVAASRSGTDLRLFINGELKSTVTNSTNFATGIVSLGASNAGTNAFPGYISGLRFVKGTALYTATFTIPSAPPTAVSNTNFLANFTNAGIYDTAAKNDLETVGNAQVSTTQAKFGTTSIAFDGTGDRLVFPTPIIQASGAVTIEMFVYANNTTGAQCLLSQYNSSDTGRFQILWNSVTSKFVLSIGGSNTIVSTNTYSTATWYYLAIVKDASNNWTMYVDGSSAGTATNSTAIAQLPTFVGDRSTTDTPFNGYIDELRITRFARTISGVPTAAFPVQ